MIAARLPAKQLVDDIAHLDQRFDLVGIDAGEILRLADAVKLPVDLPLFEIEGAFADAVRLGVDSGKAFRRGCARLRARGMKAFAAMWRAACAIVSSSPSTGPTSTGSAAPLHGPSQAHLPQQHVRVLREIAVDPAWGRPACRDRSSDSQLSSIAGCALGAPAQKDDVGGDIGAGIPGKGAVLAAGQTDGAEEIGAPGDLAARAGRFPCRANSAR